MTELPADLLVDGLLPVGGCQSSGFGGICGGTQGVRAHVRDACGLPGRSGRRCGRRTDVTSCAIGEEAAADLRCDAKFAAGKRAGPGDGVAGAAIARSFKLEQSQHPLSAVRRPARDDPPVSFAQRLWRTHGQIVPPAVHGAWLHLKRNRDSWRMRPTSVRKAALVLDLLAGPDSMVVAIKYAVGPVEATTISG
jgi:hypothetical protein